MFSLESLKRLKAPFIKMFTSSGDTKRAYLIKLNKFGKNKHDISAIFKPGIASIYGYSQKPER
jgi:hypothetical protein